ncbi:phage tail sheath family protein [Serratia proteamaculans]
MESAVPLFIGYTAILPASLPVFVASFAEFETQFGGPHTGNAVLYYSMKHFFDNGGLGGYVFSLGTYDDLDLVATPKASPKALETAKLARAIAAEQSITLLAFPDSVLVADEETSEWQQIWQIMLSLCQLRTGLFAVLDSPNDPENARLCLNSYNGMNSEWGGVWWPRLVTPYLKDNIPVVVPPSGAVLAAIQQTDSASGVWSAPANITLSLVTRPSHSWLDASALFDPNGASLNLIRSFPGRGTRIWGCRTLTSDKYSSYRHVQTRRLISWCESNIGNLGRMFVFEPNTELTWYKLKGFTTNWLRRLWQQGGLYGEQEQEAFQILLGLEETMTQEDIRAGKMIMNIRLAVLSPAEFIELSLVFMMNGDAA